MTTKALPRAAALANLISLTLFCAGCSDSHPVNLPSGPAAYDIVPAMLDEAVDGAIQPGDRLQIKVLGESELTSDQYRVDDGGNLEVPLAGDLVAGGKTPAVLRQELTRRLARYIREPYVSINIVEHSKSGVTVEGQVKEPGRFERTAGLTLIGAIALARGLNENAKADEAIIQRTIDGKPMAARFDLDAIRKAQAADPQIVGGDKVIVGYSRSKGTYHEFVKAAPIFSLFYFLKP